MKIIKPKKYALHRKNSKDYPALVLFLGEWDSIENYNDITKEEYDTIVATLEKEQQLNIDI